MISIFSTVTFVLILSYLEQCWRCGLHVTSLLTWTVPCENVSVGICGQQQPRSACAFAQSDRGLHCPLTDTLDTTECLNEEQRPGLSCSKLTMSLVNDSLKFTSSDTQIC